MLLKDYVSRKAFRRVILSKNENKHFVIVKDNWIIDKIVQKDMLIIG